MLQQILTDMFISPELLAELSEEQKQVLFIKMREEQVRRWKDREARLEKEDATLTKPKKASVKSVQWLAGMDSDVWVWVMGDHPADQSYEQICDDIIAQRAACQAQREAEELRVKKEAELVKRFSSVLMDSELQLWKEEVERQEVERQEVERQEVERQEVERQEVERRAAAQEQSQQEKREAEERRRAEEEVRRVEQKRKQEIYMDLREIREERDDQHWQDSLRKSKAADLRRRSIAKQTRDDHRRQSVKALERGRVAAVTKAFGGDRPALPPKPKPRNLTVTSDTLNPKHGVRRTLSTSSREHIIRWFQEEQLPYRAGFQKDQSRIASWFHGIISRQEAEDLLSEGEPGHFLVRVSERILGYVLSYRCKEEFKHFLVDATEGCYMLLGHQIRFTSLAELVEFHEGEPITMSGGEQLLQPCGQRPSGVDYADLFT
ncbi:SH2 domain-containing protein 4A isoform X2 [Oncorhynchus keta]|uniref:SH2 domain-containing protein 4A isoform X2 n=1 Tax=Oncorhynchus keta TaxID=8018 RepID=UPI0015FA2327|nr:SH2 domain-containing protein 4A isoform X2 [Oncorhynchus keta]